VVHYIGHVFSAKQIKKIRDLIICNPTYIRAKIAHEVCVMFGLYQSNGKPKKSWVSVILKRMDMDNLIFLPPVLHKVNVNHRSINRPVPKPPRTLPLDSCELNCELKQLQFIPVKTNKDFSLWNDLIAGYHYIGGYRLFGAQMKYLVYGGEKVKVIGKYSGKHPVAIGKSMIWTDQEENIYLPYLVLLQVHGSYPAETDLLDGQMSSASQTLI